MQGSYTWTSIPKTWEERGQETPIQAKSNHSQHFTREHQRVVDISPRILNMCQINQMKLDVSYLQTYIHSSSILDGCRFIKRMNPKVREGEDRREIHLVAAAAAKAATAAALAPLAVAAGGSVKAAGGPVATVAVAARGPVPGKAPERSCQQQRFNSTVQLRHGRGYVGPTQKGFERRVGSTQGGFL